MPFHSTGHGCFVETQHGEWFTVHLCQRPLQRIGRIALFREENKSTNEEYMDGGEIIRKLVETRAKGGNFLLNVGPSPDGKLPIEQEERLLGVT